MGLVFQQFLAKHNYSNFKIEFEDNYESHPNYPSLFAVTDTYTLLGIENIAANVPKDQLEELPDCFLGYIENENKSLDLALVEKLKDKVKLQFDNRKVQFLTIKEFNEKWNGVIIAIEPNVKKEKKTNSSIRKIAFVTASILGLFLLKQGLQFSNLAIFSFIFYTIGFVVSIFIIQEKLDHGQESIAKLCSFNENTSCDSVIKSTGAKINKWLDFSDLPILFFSVSVIAMLIDGKSYLIINGISLLSLPIIFFSVWLQKVKLKKWCVLCLVVSTLLVIQATLFIASGFVFKRNINGLLLGAIVTISLWFFIKGYLESNAALEKTNKDLKRFKRNFKIFELLKQPLKTSTSELRFSTIEIGSEKNPIKFSLALSPSCGHCHTAFEQVLKLYNSNFNQMKVSIIFNLNPDNKDNPYLDIAKTTLQINKNNPENIIEALSDWHIKKMTLSEWLFKWEQIRIDKEIIDDLQLQYQWCLQNQFNYTPVKIINDCEYPKEYDLEELRYFISELEEEIKPIVLV